MQSACAVLYRHLQPVWFYDIFSTWSHKRHDFRGKKVIEYKMCVLIFSTTFDRNISHSKKNSARYHKRIRKCSCKIPNILARCRSQWPRSLRSRSAAARLLRSWVRIPKGAWMFVCCECFVL